MGCGDEDREEHKSGGIWFIHATDPHVFLYTAQDKDKDQKAIGEAQQKLDDKALSDMLQHINSLPPDSRPPAFIVLTGDLGVEPCSIVAVTPASGGSATTTTVSTNDCVSKVDPKKRADQIDHMAELLGESPVKDIYIVAGNNDIPNEDAAEDGLIYFNSFLADVQKKIAGAKKDVRLHNLSQCYVSTGGKPSDCVADIPNTSYRMIGFPSYSFKNRDTGTTNLPLQEKQFATFKSLLDDARNAGKKVLVISHIPEMDDPYTLGEKRYKGKPPGPSLDTDSANLRDTTSTWNVSKKLLDEWESVIASDTVAGVLAGHLHDSHKEIYRQPYTWSKTNDQPRGFSKLYLAPPLSVKNQDISPIQARGFSLVHLTSDRIDPSLYWYNSENGTFQFDDSSREGKHRRWFLSRAVLWLWQLADSQGPLERLAVLLIAFLAAFLTVVQIWQIPPPDNPLTSTSNAQPAGGSSNAGGAQTGAPKPAFDPSPFASNFGKTVIAGLGGLAAETVLKSLEKKPTGDDKEFYVIWFAIFLFGLLIVMAAFRGAVEGFRAHLLIVNFSRVPSGGNDGSPWPKSLRWIGERFQRLWHWSLSLRVPVLTFLDTFVNLIQGKNQTNTLVFSDKIIEQQRNVVRVAKSIQTQLNELIVTTLPHKQNGHHFEHTDVRVNISVLSSDLTNVFYIATAPGSAVKKFPKTSVAWVSVFTGKIRWYLASYRRPEPNVFDRILLFDNNKGKIPGSEDQIFLKSYYQPRDEDYEAFVVLPVPWPSRSFDENQVKGAIHISFRWEEQFKSLWKMLSPKEIESGANTAHEEATKGVEAAIHAAPTREEKEKLTARKEADIKGAFEVWKKVNADPLLYPPIPVHSGFYTYKTEEQMLEDRCKDLQVRAVLRSALVVLGELLRGFNENIYWSSGGPDKQ
jgi:hypothetical protein